MGERGCAEQYGPEVSGPITDTMERLGLFDRVAIGARDLEPGTKLDALCILLQKQLGYQSGERDLVLLSHEFVTVSATGGRTAVSAELVRLGSAGSVEGTSAMAETVGTPCALAAEMMLAGAFPSRGVIRPVTADIYNPLLAGLEQHG